MDAISQQLEEAARRLGFEGRCRKCASEEASRLVDRVKEAFVDGDPSQWWTSLKGVTRSVPYASGDGPDHLLEHIPADAARCWLLTDEEAPSVYEIETGIAASLIRECELFEYYLVGLDLSWMVVENDHNVIMIAHRR
jgi:hypothetical protein